MAETKRKASADAGQKDPEGTGKYLYILKHKHAAALRRASLQRAIDGDGRPDASALLREILEAWMAKGKR